MSIKSRNLKIIQNKHITSEVYELILEVDENHNAKYGQFINIKLDNLTLRRPFSITLIEDNKLTICYRVIGNGTKVIRDKQVGETLEVLYPLGTGFELPDNKEDKILVIGGGIGVTPLYGWYKELEKNGYNVECLLGFKNISESIYVDMFNPKYISYDDKDTNIIQYIKNNNIEYDYYYSCGPMGMLKELSKLHNNGQLLLEERMGCGFGACMGCSYKIGEDEYKRVCVEGPMFYAKEMEYENNNL
ncbi:MAG: hypothetical protein ACRC5R_02170 [Mycoplasmatales bacterium]